MLCALGFHWDKEQVDKQDSEYLINVLSDSLDFINKIFDGKTPGIPLMDLSEIIELKGKL